MADFSRNKDYSYLLASNANKKDFMCPYCKKSFPLDSTSYSDFELYREHVFSPKIGYRIYKAAYRICPKCKWKMEATLDIPRRIFIVAIILAIVSITVTSIIDFNHVGLYVLGFWLLIGTPAYILVWLIIFMMFWKQNRKIDFDDALSKNAIEWNEKIWNKKK